MDALQEYEMDLMEVEEQKDRLRVEYGKQTSYPSYHGNSSPSLP